ncbi:DUF1217 domain-containing protein [Pseudorhodobacter aquimaris]|uniref:DUF1217 domain-containing protein n=1 Tax=Pseudorhodobacter aquimaris TaxID=687412 RepID=UPI00067D61EB|nr:DUF1217 domain-containing protein [Pseudorhodobacter aquimaris]
MSFSPIVPFGGYSGWAFLQRTLPEQKEAFQSSATLARDEDYFRANIGSIQTAEDLVSDHRLLKVALGAFGLDDDINNKYFIQKVLDDGTLDASALGNKLADKQYLALSASFGFGDSAIPNTQNEGFADKILTAYQDRQFETAVGEQDEDLRFALNAERELAVLAAKDNSDDTKWYSIMGNEPLRQVFEKALGLPSSFATLDLDMQLSTLKAKTQKTFGDSGVAQFADAENLDALIKRFLIRSEALASFSSTSSGSIALTLLQG